MFERWRTALPRGEFLPHGTCFLWNKPLLTLHVVSDSLIAISYYSIPFALAYFVVRRSDLVYRRMFLLFAAFILACGTTHLFDVWTIWTPRYDWQGVVKLLTAVLSTATAIVLWRAMPGALSLPSPAQLARIADQLRDEVAEHQCAVSQLHTEVAERKGVEAALRASEQRLELALLGADLGLWDWNIQTGAVVFSHRWATMLGYTLDEIKPDFQNWLRLIHPEDLPRVMDRLNTHLLGATPIYEVEHRLRTRDGLWLWVLARGKVFDWDPAGQPLRAAGTHMDISERKDLEDRLQRQQEELCYAQRLTTAGELAATVAHELNQPLGAIANYTGGATLRFRELLQANPALDEVLQTILKLSNRAADVISGIRDLVRKHELRREWVDVEKTLRTVLPLVHADLQRKNIRFSVDIEPGLPPVWGQSIYLQQMVLNLLLNGMDAMDPAQGGRRELGLWACRSDGQIEIGVRDTGPGFAPEVAERIFQPFVSTKPDGIGLGLSICRTIVEAHHGRIWADSASAVGVTWHVLLPVDTGSSRDVA